MLAPKKKHDYHDPLNKTQNTSSPYHKCLLYIHLFTTAEKAISLFVIASTSGFLSVSQITPSSGNSAVARYLATCPKVHVDSTELKPCPPEFCVRTTLSSKYVDMCFALTSGVMGSAMLLTKKIGCLVLVCLKPRVWLATCYYNSRSGYVTTYQGRPGSRVGRERSLG
jgi:hypothetical protein